MKYSERTTHIKHIMHLHNIILCGLRKGSSHKPKIRPYSELHCCSPSGSANCFLPNIVTAELYCFFFWRSQFNRRMQDIISWYVVDKNLCPAKDM